MNCEQTREKIVLHRQEDMLDDTERGDFLQHLRGCKTCQEEYEALLHTATMLDSLETPIPPPELLGNIQEQIRQIHKQSRTALFAVPFSWFLAKLKLDISPKLVNCAALVCYLLVSVFLLKAAFFTDKPNEDFGMTAMEASRLSHVRISSSPWASLKHIGATTDKNESTVVSNDSRVGFSEQFVGLPGSEMWQLQNNHKDTNTVDANSSSTTSNKLALFWSDIKASL